MREFFVSIAQGIFDYRYEILSVAAGLAAAGVMANVLRRLESGGSRQVGRRIGWLCALLTATVGSAFRAFETADGSYLAAFSVLALGGVIWIVLRSRALDSPLREPPRAALTLLAVGTLLLAVLWVVQKSVETLLPTGVEASNVTQFIGTVTGAGLLAMSIVQGLRTLLPVRGIFHRAIVERWIDESLYARPATTLAMANRRVTTTKRLLRAVMTLARASAAGERYALLDLPIEQLCGQIAAGADRLLDDPESLPPFQWRRSRDDRSRRPKRATEIPPRPSTELARVRFLVLSMLAAGSADVRRFLDLAPKIAAASKDGLEAPAASRDYVRLRANLSQRIQRNIDRLQIETSFWWKRALRGLAFEIGR